MTTKQQGNFTELKCLAGFVEQGCNVSIPYGEDSKYDFIADINGKLIRVQVKTSSPQDENAEAICFSCRSTHKNFKGVANVRYSPDDVDYFATYWNNKVFLVPIKECSTQKTLRIVPPKNGHSQKNTNYASDYELSVQLQKIREEEVAEH